MTTVTYEAFAYLSEYHSVESVGEGLHLPHICQDKSGYFESEGYPMIGTATVTITLHSQDKIIQGQIEALNKKLQKERAESQLRQNAILDQISKLQALTFAEMNCEVGE